MDNSGFGIPRMLALVVGLHAAVCFAAEPVRLHPANPHYFLFRGQPTVLVGSTEHYGAVLNLDFDYRKYLDTLAADGLNLARLFVGSYVEKPGDFGIQANTLAPASDRLIVPWTRSTVPGYAGGGNRFDLDRWDADYFVRLEDFIGEAARRGVVVEVTLFSSVYSGFGTSPLHDSNNVNHTGVTDKRKVNTLDNGPLLAYQESLTRKVVAVLRRFDNVIFEIQNEPWADHPDRVDVVHPYFTVDEVKQEWMLWKNRVELAGPDSLTWQSRIAAVIAEAEKSGSPRHLISQDVANFRFPLPAVDPAVSIVNFHYASPDAVAPNWHFARVIGFNETGFAGSADDTYRKQAWRFLLSGGALFDHLDYSFAVGHEDGTAHNEAPGGGSAALRKQFGILKAFVNGLDLAKAREAPAPTLVTAAPGVHTYALAAPGSGYAVYADGGRKCVLTLDLPPGRYEGDWLDPRTGARQPLVAFVHRGGPRTVESPPYDGDIALGLRLTPK